MSEFRRRRGYPSGAPTGSGLATAARRAARALITDARSCTAACYRLLSHRAGLTAAQSIAVDGDLLGTRIPR